MKSMGRLLFASFLVACGGAAQDASTPSSATSAPSASPSASAAPAAAQGAVLGKPAPDFTLHDVDGKTFTLSQFRGKTVVLEWFNPGCPFVTRNHQQGPLKDMAARAQKDGVVWLSINSNGPGTQGHGVDNNKAGIAAFHIVNPVLLDEDGKVGHAYGARTTPHMFVVDPAGVLVYRGAIDDAQDGDTEGKPFANYVADALADLAAKRPVRTPETPSYGCSVKYAP